MTLDMDSENNIPNKFPVAFQNDSFVYHIDIESKLNDLIDRKLMRAKPGVVKIMERKGLNLFHPFIDRIVERHSVSTLNINKSSLFTVEKTIQNRISRLFRFLALLKIVKHSGYLLTDAVNGGKDVRDVNDVLSQDNTKLVLVCGYLCKKQSLENIRPIYPGVQFEFVHYAETEEDYWNEITRLTQLSHTRLEPLDRDHCYHIYKFKSDLTKDQTLEIFTNFFQNTLGMPCIFEEDSIRPYENKVQSYTAYFHDLSPLNEKISMIQSPDFDIETPLFFRLKFDGTRSLVRIMPFFEVSVDIKSLVNDKSFCSKLPNLCCPKSCLKNRPSVRCVQCIENNLAYMLLGGIKEQFSNDPIIRGYHIRLVAEYYPCNSF
jgi:hypothetical protein